MQSSHFVPYFVHLMGIDPASKPWTMELMNCATAIANVAKMQYKAHYRRVRPSTLCAGLVPPWGPPQHPSFPSGHSTAAHLCALLLMRVEGIAARFGVFPSMNAKSAGPAHTPSLDDLLTKYRYGQDHRSPLLWLAWRLAKGRERIGVHYATDSASGRVLAALLWDACTSDAPTVTGIKMPTLHSVIERAQAEWPNK